MVAMGQIICHPAQRLARKDCPCAVHSGRVSRTDFTRFSAVEYLAVMVRDGDLRRARGDADPPPWPSHRLTASVGREGHFANASPESPLHQLVPGSWRSADKTCMASGASGIWWDPIAIRADGEDFCPSPSGMWRTLARPAQMGRIAGGGASTGATATGNTATG